VAPEELARLQRPEVRAAAETAVREAGYSEVRIDPEGYRRGRLNEALKVVQVTGDSRAGPGI
jgi:PP-loop superfamily ATP-utilizing enzyme